MKAKNAIPFAVSALALATSSALAGVGPIYVCNPGGDYTTIQAAVNAAGPWDTITVCPGHYNEQVTIPNTKDGLTIQSEEIATLGENTWVRGFKTIFASNEGPEYVTVQGFWIREVYGSPCQIGIESSGNYATFAHNRLTNCNGAFAGDPAFRINRGVDGNNIHHNVIEGSGIGAAGLLVEGYCEEGENSGNCEPDGPGDNHNIHQNYIVGAGGNCIYLAGGTSFVNLHQNAIDDCGGDGILFESYDEFDAESSNVHHNVVCDRINLPNAETADNYVHHNFANQLTCSNSVNTCKKNTVDNTSCPLDED